MKDQTAKHLSTLHRVLYRCTRGMVGRRLVGNDMCLLSTTGRRSGEVHTVPLLYLRDGDRLVVVASWGGRDHHPDWYENLLVDPHATVQVLGDSWAVAGGNGRFRGTGRLVAQVVDGIRRLRRVRRRGPTERSRWSSSNHAHRRNLKSTRRRAAAGLVPQWRPDVSSGLVLLRRPMPQRHLRCRSRGRSASRVRRSQPSPCPR